MSDRRPAHVNPHGRLDVPRRHDRAIGNVTVCAGDERIAAAGRRIGAAQTLSGTCCPYVYGDGVVVARDIGEERAHLGTAQDRRRGLAERDAPSLSRFPPVDTAGQSNLSAAAASTARAACATLTFQRLRGLSAAITPRPCRVMRRDVDRGRARRAVPFRAPRRGQRPWPHRTPSGCGAASLRGGRLARVA